MSLNFANPNAEHELSNEQQQGFEEINASIICFDDVEEFTELARTIDSFQFSRDLLKELLINCIYSGEGAIDALTILLEHSQGLFNAVLADPTPVIQACAVNGQDKCLALLMQYDSVRAHLADNENEAFRTAASRGHTRVLDILLEVPVVVNNVTAKQNFALIFAVDNGHTEVVKRLLQFQAVQEEINALDSFAVERATENKDLQNLELLFKANANIDKVFSDVEIAATIAMHQLYAYFLMQKFKESQNQYRFNQQDTSSTPSEEEPLEADIPKDSMDVPNPKHLVFSKLPWMTKQLVENFMKVSPPSVKRNSKEFMPSI